MHSETTEEKPRRKSILMQCLSVTYFNRRSGFEGGVGYLHPAASFCDISTSSNGGNEFSFLIYICTHFRTGN